MKGLTCLGKAFVYLGHKGLRRYIFIPLFINILLYAVGIWTLIHYFSILMARFLPSDSWFAFLHWLLWPFIAAIIIILVLYSFSLLANIIAAPFNSFLSAAVEKLETGQIPESGMSLSKEIWHSIIQEIRKTCFFLIRAIPIILISFIPLLNIITPLLWFLYFAWSTYVQYMDYPMANNGIFFSEQRRILRSHINDMLSFGGIASLLLLIPVINLVAMPICVIAATIFWAQYVRPSF